MVHFSYMLTRIRYDRPCETCEDTIEKGDDCIKLSKHDSCICLNCIIQCAEEIKLSVNEVQ